MEELLKKYIGKRVTFRSSAKDKCTCMVSGTLGYRPESGSLPWEVMDGLTSMAYFDLSHVDSAVERENDLMIWARISL